MKEELAASRAALESQEEAAGDEINELRETADAADAKVDRLEAELEAADEATEGLKKKLLRMETAMAGLGVGAARAAGGVDSIEYMGSSRHAGAGDHMTDDGEGDCEGEGEGIDAVAGVKRVLQEKEKALSCAREAAGDATERAHRAESALEDLREDMLESAEAAG